jgi:hypothetical protein
VGVGDNNDLPLMTEAIGEVRKRKRKQNKTKQNKTKQKQNETKRNKTKQNSCPFSVTESVQRNGSKVFAPFGDVCGELDLNYCPPFSAFAHFSQVMKLRIVEWWQKSAR